MAALTRRFAPRDTTAFSSGEAAVELMLSKIHGSLAAVANSTHHIASALRINYG